MPTVQDIRGNTYPAENLVIVDRSQGLAIELRTRRAVTIASVEGAGYLNILAQTSDHPNGPIAGMAVVPAGTETYFLQEITVTEEPRPADEVTRISFVEERKIYVRINALEERRIYNSTRRAESIIITTGRALIRFQDGTAGIYKASLNHSTFKLFPGEAIDILNLDGSILEASYNPHNTDTLYEDIVSGEPHAENDNNTPIGEAQPLLTGSAGYNFLLPIDHLDDDAFVDYVKRRAATNPLLKSKLVSDLTVDFEQAAQSTPILESISTLAPESVPTLPLPDKAPRLWADRDPGTNPADFIRANYGEMHGEPLNRKWLNCGITRPDLKSNPGLYNAYASWIGDHPEDKLDFAPGGGKPPGRPRTADPIRTVERNRENALATAARRREQRNSGPNSPR